MRHLDIGNTPRLNKMPLGIGGLAGLQTLPKVIIEGGDGFKISELKSLSDLQGRLFILGLENVIIPIQAEEYNLQQKNGLDDLEMKWSKKFDDSRNHMIEYKVLEGLRPHHKLRKLEILLYGGMEFPSWVGDPSFDRLTQLTLRGCVRCTRLPTLGHLQSLKKLYVGGMNGVTTLGFELLGHTDSFRGIAFPLLEVLELVNMQGWERWSTRRVDSDGTCRSFPRLGNISIRACPKLVEISIDLIPSLGVLHIQGCSEEVLKSMIGVSSSIGKLTMEDINGLSQLNGEVLELLGAVEDLCIRSCNELRYLSESNSDAWKFLVSLRKLKIWDCKKLLSSEEKGVNLKSCMEYVREVSIFNCKSLESYNCPNSVEWLRIWKCRLLTSLIFSMVQDHPSSLKTLVVQCCHNLVDLIINNCDNVGLNSKNCFGFLPLENLQINDCKNLKLFPHEHLVSLTSLEDLVIHKCPSMDYSFPCGLWPPNLRSLTIGCLNKPMSEWGIQNYPTSLVRLRLYGENSGVVSFVANAKDVTSSSFLLPPSLTFLAIHDFMDVESVSEVLQHLPCLKELEISSCPKLKVRPKINTTGTSYLKLRVYS